MVIKINKRELLLFTASIAGIVAAGSVSYSFLQQMSPDLTAYSDSVVDINLSNIAVGKAIFVKWRGSIVVIKNRTPEEIAYAKNIPLSKLKDKFARNPNLPENTPATDLARSGGVEHENFLIYINHCTHLGCPMLDQMDSKTEFIAHAMDQFMILLEEFYLGLHRKICISRLINLYRIIFYV